MTDAALFDLARVGGVEPVWKDVFGQVHQVQPPTLRAILSAIGLPADTESALADSAARLAHSVEVLPPLLTADVGETIRLPMRAAGYRLELEDGRVFEGRAESHPGGCAIPAILEDGYHRLNIGGASCVLAVAPHRCFTPAEALDGAKGWGLAVQLYSLRRNGDAGVGDFAALAEFAASARKHGAHALAISPVHAQFSADPDRFSPYAPSSRTALNVLHAAVERPDPELASQALVDWPEVARRHLAELRRMFAAAELDPGEMAAFEAFMVAQGARLHEHALFEALHAHVYGEDKAKWHWREWPAGLRDKRSTDVQQFAAQFAGEVRFHTWLQFQADRGLAQAQQSCRDAGMRIGLVSDLAVGTDSGGSQCWGRQTETLLGLTVGAPPDLMQRDGQNWGLSAFSPIGLMASGFATYREMLQTALAHAGGMRIDHAMGLNRLWVIPEGGSGADGAYLSFPETDLLRLIKLESRRHRAIVLAEDLGTVPDGFQDRLRGAGIDGMRVLFFERDAAQNFVSPSAWTREAAAMTSTHDLPTLAGWWSGRDIVWRDEMGQVADAPAAVEARGQDRALLWDAMCAAGSAEGAPPGDAGEFVDAACVHVGRSACELVMLPLEDALGLVEQPNLPGTLDEHPNWRRRMPADVDRVLEEGATPQRLAALNEARRH